MVSCHLGGVTAMLWWILLVVLVLYIWTKWYRLLSYWKYKGVPYISPWYYFRTIIKNLIIRKTAVEQFQELYYHHPKAKFIGVIQLNRPALMIRDPEMMKQVLVKNFENFINHTVVFTEDIEPLLGKNLVSLRGQRWKDMRTTLSPAFTSSKMRAMYVLIRECAEQFTQHFLEAEKQGPVIVEMKDVFTKYTNDVIATCAFGITCDSLKDDKNEFYVTGKSITAFNTLSKIKLFGFLLFPKLMKALNINILSKKLGDFFRTIIRTTIETRERKGIVRPDMIHLLMEAKKGRLKHDGAKDDDAGFATVVESHQEDGVDKPPLTEEDITAQAILFFLGGYETTSTLMCFLAHELAVNVDIQQKLQAEIDDSLQKGQGSIDYESLLKMKYLDMVISECLRKWPPAPLTERLTNNPLQLTHEDSSAPLEKDQSIWIPVYCLHHDPKYFPDPERFDPERFNDENKHLITPFTYLPFGAGPRSCIASRFALLEIKALIVHLLMKFDIVVVEKTQVPLKLSKNQFAMTAEKGFWLGFKTRK